MTDAERDPVLRSAIDELRRLPAADPESVNRVIRAAAAARVSPADDDVVEPSRGTFVWICASAGLVAAASVLGFIARDRWIRQVERVPAVAATTSTFDGVRSASANRSDVVAIPHQFVLRSATARHVSVVGDFNSWNPRSAPLVPSSDGAWWSTIIPVMPGRHLYGFIVDSVFVLDPRAPKSQDPDLGSDGSVVIVGRP